VLEDVVKSFGEVKAVNGISLKIEDKELLILLGPSGSGKTTMMRLIAGLDEITAGNIYIGGKLVNELRPRERDIAMVFQSYALYPHFTVYDNIAFPLRMRKTSKADTDAQVRKTAELLGLSDLLKRRPKQLSGGEQQRVALGRALVREPKVFLMDEPLSNIDAKLRLYMRAELKALQKRLGITTIYVTHDQVEAMTMGDRIALMDKGSLLQVGTPDEIYSHPSTEFVGGFIGSPPMNLIPCSILKKNNHLFLDASSFTVDVTEMRSSIEGKASSEVTLGIRPESISVSSDKTADGIEGKVYVIEPLGSEVILDIKVNGTIIKVLSHLKTVKVSPGDNIRLAFDHDGIVVFDRKTGKALV